jgi:hypothetical protein
MAERGPGSGLLGTDEWAEEVSETRSRWFEGAALAEAMVLGRFPE